MELRDESFVSYRFCIRNITFFNFTLIFLKIEYWNLLERKTVQIILKWYILYKFYIFKNENVNYFYVQHLLLNMWDILLLNKWDISLHV